MWVCDQLPETVKRRIPACRQQAAAHIAHTWYRRPASHQRAQSVNTVETDIFQTLVSHSSPPTRKNHYATWKHK